MKKYLLSTLIMALGLVTLFLGGCSSQKTEAPTTPATTAQATTYNWKMVSAMPPGHVANRQILDFAKNVEKSTNGRVKITVFENTLGAPTDAWDMAKSNTAQLAWTTDATNLARMPITAMVELPFELNNTKVTYKVLDAWLNAGYLKELTDNFKVLGFMPIYPQTLFLKNKKVTTMEDFKGLKVRTAAGLLSQTITSIGATGVTIGGGEVYMSLDRGVIDAAISAVDNATERKYDEVIKYVVKASFTEGAFVLLLNKETWNSLPPDLQKIVEQTAKDASDTQSKSYLADEQAVWDAFGKKVEVYSLSKEVEAQMKKATEGVTDKYVKDVTAKGYPAKEALDLMRKVVSENTK